MAGRALELIIYPPIPPDPSEGKPYTRMSSCYRATEAWRSERGREQQLSRRKRLSDSDLAAEYWRAGDGMSEVNYDRGVDAEPIAKILHRFATLPDYDRPERVASRS